MMECEREYKCKNGISIYYYKNPALHSFYISLYLRAGCMYESDSELGITHFLEHALIRNVNKLYGMELYTMLDKLGLEFNASTYSEMVQFYISGAKAHLPEGIDIISKLLSPIVLTSAEVTAERKRIKAEIRESDDKTSLATFSNKIVFDGSTLANPIAGTNASVDRIGTQALENYRRRVMTPERMFFYVTGSFGDEELFALAEKIGEIRLESRDFVSNIAPVPKDFGCRCGLVNIKNADYTKLRFTFDIDMTRYTVAETDLLYDMLLSGYNSKLFVEMSEKRGMFYDVSGSSERYKNIGTLSFSYEVKERDIYDAVRLTLEILNSVKRIECAEAEIVRAGYVDNAEMLLDDARDLNFTFAYDNHVMSEGYTTVAMRRAGYAEVTAERLCEIASEVFVKSNFTLAVKCKKKRVDEEKINEIIACLL